MRVKAVIVFLATLAAPASAQTIDAGDVKLKLIGRVQAQFNTTSVDEAELIAAGRAPATAIPASTFEIRRVRFGTELEYEKWLTGKLELEFAMARLQMRDMFINMNFDPRFNFRVGQFKKPFSLLQLTSSTTWPVIERGVRTRGLSELMSLQDSLGGTRLLTSFRGTQVLPEEQELLEVFGYQNFDLGASVHGRFGGLGYHVGVFNGTGSDRPDDSDEKSYAARLTYKLPIDLPVTLGAALSHREYRVTNTPAITTNDGTAYEVDVEVGAFRRKGFRLLGEVALGDNLSVADEFLGGQAILAWFYPLENARFEGIELAARASYGDPQRDVDNDGAWLFTPGINLYFFGRNRLMLNWDFFHPSDERFSSENALRAQAQIVF
jgi:hypothetical protein